MGKHSALLECNKFSGYDFFPADIYRWAILRSGALSDSEEGSALYSC